MLAGTQPFGGLQMQVWGAAIAGVGACKCSRGGAANAASAACNCSPTDCKCSCKCSWHNCTVRSLGLHRAAGRAALCSRAGCTVQSGTAADAQPRSTARQRGPLHMQPLHMQLELLQVQQEPSCKCSRFLYRVYLHMLHVQAFYLHVQPAELHVQRGGLQMQRSFCICSDARCTCSCICSAPGCTDTLRLYACSRIRLHLQLHLEWAALQVQLHYAAPPPLQLRCVTTSTSNPSSWIAELARVYASSAPAARAAGRGHAGHARPARLTRRARPQYTAA